MTATDPGRQLSTRSQGTPATVVKTTKKQERNLTRLEAKLESERARAEFARTLNSLEEKLNVPKQLQVTSARAKVKLRRFANEQPGAAVAVVVGVAAVVGVTVWLIVRAATNKP